MDETGTTHSSDDTAVTSPAADALASVAIPVHLPEPVAIDPMLAEALPPEVAEVVFVPDAVPEVAPEGDPTPLPDSLFSNSHELENSSAPAPFSEPTPVQGVPLGTPNPVLVQAPEESRVVERVVEKIVEKEVVREVIKEVPVEVEKIVEKIVEVEKPVEKIVAVDKIIYRDAEQKVCPPPTDKEIEAIHKDFMIRLNKEGVAKKHELMIEKMNLILTLSNTKPEIVRQDVMDLLECSGTTATRLLTELKHEGKLLLHGTSPHSFTYTKPS
jgi:hypothetical protein